MILRIGRREIFLLGILLCELDSIYRFVPLAHEEITSVRLGDFVYVYD